MSALAPIVFVLVFAAVLGLAGWLVVRTARRNRASSDPAAGAGLARLAAAKGWTYRPRDEEFPRRFRGYPFGHGGRTRPALDLVTGTHRGREFACFQFVPARSLPAGEYPARVRHARVVAVSLPAPVPTVLVTAAARTPRRARRFTTGDDAFDRAYAVGTGDEPFAGRLLTALVRRWLLDNPPAGSLRFAGPELIAWHADTGGFDAGMVEPAVDRLCDLLDRLPADAAG
ncbi:MAG TPA: hypothetical protein VGP26_26485 [Actinophytocola sp.]|jgi:hypothetical protein|nr:hypothetical protein [Actinophytocola sp.]